MGNGRPITDITGQTFDRLTVTTLAPREQWGRGNDAYWLCECSCGRQTTVRTDKLRNGTIKSCGCLRIEMGRQRARLNTIHGNSSRGGSTPEYRAWRTMKDRCLNPNNRAWSRYGGRGITVCERWKESFPAFFADMGPKSDPSLTLARIKTSGNYEPGNCRWADRVAETRANISASLMGHAVSAETRERMRASRLGWKHTPESIAKMGLAGSANGNFKEAPGYEGVHLRAKNHLRHVTICPQCGSTKRLQVALRHDAPSESIRTVTRGGYPCRYSIAWPPDLGYQRLCAKCHHAYDHS